MPQVVMIIPLDANGALDYQFEDGEDFTFDTGETVERTMNEFVEQATDELPAGYDSYKINEAFTDEDGTVIGYKLTCFRNEVVPVLSGGLIGSLSPFPPIDAPPDTVVGVVQSTEALLNDIDGRLQGQNAMWGIPMGYEVQDD